MFKFDYAEDMRIKSLPLTIVLAAGFTISVSCQRPADAATKPSYDKKMQLGQLLYFNGNVEQAIKAFRTAAQLKPAAFEPHLNLVNIYVQKGDLAEAVTECKEVLKIKPNHRDVHLILGNLLRSLASSEKDPEMQKQLLDEAAKEVEAARSLKADPALIENTLGIIKVQQGKHDEAMQHMENALKEKANLPDAHLVKGVLHFKKGEKDLSLKHLDLAIKHKGKNAEARNTKADILFTLGKHDEALEEYRKAAEDDSRHYPAWSGQGNIYIQRKEYEKAKECLEKAQQIKPDDKNVLYSLAVCKEKMGDIAGAIVDFEQGILVDSDPVMSAQIKLHVQQLRSGGGLFRNIPQLGDFSSSGIGPNSNLSNPVFGTESFKDLIKVGGPAPSSKEKRSE